MTKKFFQKQFVDLLVDFMYVNLKEKVKTAIEPYKDRATR